MKVTLRERKRGTKKIYYHLDIYDRGQRSYESLGLFIHQKPKTALERKHNKETKELAQNIASQRQLEYQGKAHGFPSKSMQKGSFVEYFKSLAQKRQESDGNYGNWSSALKHLEEYTPTIKFFELDKSWLEGYRVEKDRFLLWSHCLLQFDRRFNKMAFPVRSIYINQIPDIEPHQWDEIPAFSVPNDPLSIKGYLRPGDIFYVYKTIQTDRGEMFLLGTDVKINNMENIEGIIRGWVSYLDIVGLNAPIFIEPNWYIGAANERKSINRPAAIFVDKNRANRYKNCEDVPERYLLWNNDTYEKRLPAGFFRFPLLDLDEESGFIYAGVYTKNDSLGMGIFWMPGYTCLKLDCASKDLFKFVILLSRNELGEIFNYFEHMQPNLPDFQKRERIYYTWLEVIEKKMGSHFNQKIAENMSFEDLSTYLYGLPSMGVFQAEKLRSVLHPEEISDRLISEYICSIQSKLSYLKEIYNYDSSENIFRSNNNDFYWLEINALP